MQPPATVAVFGATGRAGGPVLDRLLDAGYAVRAQARTPAKLDRQDERLTVLQGDFTDFRSVSEVIAGADAVVNLVGHVKDSPDDVLARGVANVVHAMRERDVKRVVNLTGAGVTFPADQPKLIDKVARFAMRTFFKSVIRDATESSNVLRASDLDYTNVRAPRLTEDPAVGTVREGYVGQVGTAITRADLATFLVDVLQRDRYVRDEPSVSN